jgi:hypothetical protein
MSLRGLESEIKARGYRILYTSGKGDQPDYDRFVVDALFPNGKIRATAETQLKVRGGNTKQSHPDDVKAQLLAKIEELTRTEEAPGTTAIQDESSIVPDGLPSPEVTPITIEEEPVEDADSGHIPAKKHKKGSK